ncbi:MAG: hypothetical protein ACOYT8_02350 [Candidatus Dependentiae bacterium]
MKVLILSLFFTTLSFISVCQESNKQVNKMSISFLLNDGNNINSGLAKISYLAKNKAICQHCSAIFHSQDRCLEHLMTLTKNSYQFICCNNIYENSDQAQTHLYVNHFRQKRNFIIYQDEKLVVNNSSN